MRKTQMIIACHRVLCKKKLILSRWIMYRNILFMEFISDDSACVSEVFHDDTFHSRLWFLCLCPGLLAVSEWCHASWWKFIWVINSGILHLDPLSALSLPCHFFLFHPEHSRREEKKRRPYESRDDQRDMMDWIRKTSWSSTTKATRADSLRRLHMIADL